MYFSQFKRTSGQLNSKDIRRVMTRATQKEQATTTFKKKNIEHLPNVLPAQLTSFISGLGAKVRAGITFTIQFSQVQLDRSRRNLSLSIEHLFWIRFRQSAEWLSFVLCTSAWLSLCAWILVFSCFFYFLFLVCWMETSSLHVKWGGEEN